MPDLLAPLLEFRSAWRALPLGGFEKDLLKAVLSGLVFMAIVGMVERMYGARTRYSSPMFLQDAIYWLYHRGGVHGFLVFVVFFPLLESPIAWLDAHLDLRPFGSLAIWQQILIVMLCKDFLGYWVHRAQHRFAFLWAFHAVHHSQPWLTFATISRAHPLDVIITASLSYIPMRLIGVSPEWALVLSLANEFIAVVSHSQIPWSWHCLRHIFVSPRFHAYHHSIDPEHHDRNFGGVFSTWDYLFRTAVAKDVPQPVAFGLRDVQVNSLRDTLMLPFRILRARSSP